MFFLFPLALHTSMRSAPVDTLFANLWIDVSGGCGYTAGREPDGCAKRGRVSWPCHMNMCFFSQFCVAVRRRRRRQDFYGSRCEKKIARPPAWMPGPTATVHTFGTSARAQQVAMLLLKLGVHDREPCRGYLHDPPNVLMPGSKA